eukprot:1144951-Pelagomonas_calceolata.AAC.4
MPKDESCRGGRDAWPSCCAQLEEAAARKGAAPYQNIHNLSSSLHCSDLCNVQICSPAVACPFPQFRRSVIPGIGLPFILCIQHVKQEKATKFSDALSYARFCYNLPGATGL